MSATAIRVFGVFTFICEGGMLLTLISQRSRLGPLPWQAFIPTFFWFVSATLVGVELLLRKWAVILFSLALVAFPIWFTLDSIGESPFGFYLMMLALAMLLVLPIIIIVRSWPLLSWRGKWFL
jgi:hypothetical protein